MNTFFKSFFLSIILLFLVGCADVGPMETATTTPMPSPTHYPTATPTITPTESPEPIFPEEGTMRSEHLTAALSRKWMEIAGISEVKLDPDILEQIYQVMVVHWASSLASFSNKSAVKSFTEKFLCDVSDPETYFNFLLTLPKAHLQNALEAYRYNAQQSEPFDYTFDFGQGVVGRVDTIDIKVVGTEQEYKYVENELKDQGIIYVNIFGRYTDDRAMFYFGAQNDLHVYSWDGNPYKMKHLDIAEDRSYALFADLFYYTQVNGGVSIIRTHDRTHITECGGYSMHEALGCVDYYCNQSGLNPSNFVITLSNGNTIAPPDGMRETIINTPTPKLITASKYPIEMYDYTIVFSNVEILDVGSNPLGLASNLALSLVFTDAHGDTQKLRDFSQLPVWFTDASGNKQENKILQTLDPQNGTHYFRWIVYITEPSEAYYLHVKFPTGEEIVDFSTMLR